METSDTLIQALQEALQLLEKRVSELERVEIQRSQDYQYKRQQGLTTDRPRIH